MHNQCKIFVGSADQSDGRLQECIISRQCSRLMMSIIVSRMRICTLPITTDFDATNIVVTVKQSSLLSHILSAYILVAVVYVNV